MRFRLMHVALALVAVLVLMGADDCEGNNDQGNEQRDEGVSGRYETMERALSRYPNPRLENFPMRESLVKMAERQDMVNHPWYIYILGDNGNVIGYYVGKTVPINACNFLSTSEDIVKDEGAGMVTTSAPSLDGMFYGNAACDAWFFFDAATDALIQVRGANFYAADQPLLLEAEPIEVRQGQ